MFSHKNPQRSVAGGPAPQHADQLAQLIDQAESNMRGAGTALELGHALRNTLPPSLTENTTSPQPGRRSATQDEQAEEVFREVADKMILVFRGDNQDDREYIQGDPDEVLEAVVITSDEGTWVARNSESAFGGSGWEIDGIDTDVANAITSALTPEHVYTSDLPTEDPDVNGALYLDDGEVKISGMVDTEEDQEQEEG